MISTKLTLSKLTLLFTAALLSLYPKVVTPKTTNFTLLSERFCPQDRRTIKMTSNLPGGEKTHALDKMLTNSTDYTEWRKALAIEVNRIDCRAVMVNALANPNGVPDDAIFGTMTADSRDATTARKREWRNLMRTIKSSFTKGSKAEFLLNSLDADDMHAGKITQVIEHELGALNIDDQKDLSTVIKKMTYETERRIHGLDGEGYILMLRREMLRCPSIFHPDTNVYLDTESNLLTEIVRHAKRSMPRSVQGVIESFQTMMTTSPHNVSVSRLASAVRQRIWETMAEASAKAHENPAAGGLGNALVAVTPQSAAYQSNNWQPDRMVEIGGSLYTCQDLTLAQLQTFAMTEDTKAQVTGQLRFADLGLCPGDSLSFQGKAKEFCYSAQGLSNRLAKERKHTRNEVAQQHIIDAGKEALKEGSTFYGGGGWNNSGGGGGDWKPKNGGYQKRGGGWNDSNYEEQASGSRHFPKKRKVSGGSADASPKVKCQICYGKGHTAAQCPSLPSGGGGKGGGGKGGGGGKKPTMKKKKGGK